jgi:hypothetical protein
VPSHKAENTAPIWYLERQDKKVWCRKNGEQEDRGNITIVYVKNVFTDMRRREA